MTRLLATSAALVALAALGCSQHSTAPSAARPDNTAASATAPGAGDTNTFGDSKEAATGSAAQARDEALNTPATPIDSSSRSGSVNRDNPDPK